MPAEWTIAFLFGLMSSTHCLGMCGGIAGMLNYSLAPAIRERPARLALFNLSYNAGRLSSYMMAGAAMAAGGGLLAGLAGAVSPLLMSILGTLFLMAVGFHIAGLFPRFARIETLGRPVWRRLEPLGRRLLPVRSMPQAYGFGLVWGWLPCGLVYSALVYSLSTETPVHGALFMLFFGLGTLPMLLTAGVMASSIAAVLRHPLWRRVAGLSIVVLSPVPALARHWGHFH